MKFKIQKQYSLILAFIMIVVSSCEITDLDINTDPNNASEASLNLLLTSSQFGGLETFAGGLNNTTMGFQALNTSSDSFDFTNASWNGTWNFLYSGPLKDLEEIILAADPETNPHYLGIAQIMKAYYFTTMVDLWGDIPYSEAFRGNAEEPNTVPLYDSGASVYADAFLLIDQAIANLAKSQGVSVKGDILYGGSTTKWRKAAKSLKLKLLINTRNVDSNAGAIQSLIDEGDLILSASNDFALRFSALKNPDNRHPMYRSGYAGGDAGYSYFGHQLMYEMLASKDPRTPFYFKRQTATVLDPEDPTSKQTIPCSQRDDCVYNYFVTSPKVTNGVFGVDPEGLSDSQTSYLAGFFGRDMS